VGAQETHRSERQGDRRHPGQHGQERGRDRPEREEQEGEGQGKRPTLRGPGLQSAGAPQVDIDGRLAGEAKGRPRMAGAQPIRDRPHGRPKLGQALVHTSPCRVETHQQERPRATLPFEVGGRLIDVGERAGDAPLRLDRVHDLSQRREAFRMRRPRHAADHENGAPREWRLEALGEGLVDLGRFAAERPGRDLEAVLHVQGRGQEHPRGQEPGEDHGPSMANDARGRPRPVALHRSRSMLAERRPPPTPRAGPRRSESYSSRRTVAGSRRAARRAGR
jgi:hypothetical protein